MKFYNTTNTVIRIITFLSVRISCILLIFMSFFIGAEVLMRKFFNMSTKGADELSGYTLAIVSVFAFTYSFIHKGHIRIELLYSKFSKPAQRLLDLFSLSALSLYVWLLTYYGYKVLSTSFLRGSKSNTPLQTSLWLPQSIWVIGLVFFSFVLFVYFIWSINWIIRKNYDEVDKLIGCPMLEEEIQEESGIGLN